MAKSFVAVWIIALLAGCAVVLFLQFPSQKQSTKQVQRTEKQKKQGLNKALGALADKSEKVAACKRACKKLIQSPGGVENLSVVVSASIDRITTNGKCATSFNKLKELLTGNKKTKVYYKKLSLVSAQALQNCKAKNLPLYYE